MPRVEWSRRDPDEVEAVIGIMLCRENPGATRIRPASGDKGVDIYVPLPNGKWRVYQVKSFTGALTSSHKKQIRKSWETFTAFVSDNDLQIEEWLLVRPENPTWPDEDWLKKLAGDPGFPCEWRGLDFCDRLAADNPPVIDYYFLDGKERLQNALRDLLSAMGVSDDVTEPGTAYGALDSVHAAVNEHDPHYRYDFSVEHVADRRQPLANVEADGLVAAVSRRLDDREVTFRIFTRYKEATADRPVPGRFTLKAGPGTAEAEAIRDFFDYGLPAQGIPAEDMHIDLPGGLGGSEAAGIVSLGPARLDTARPIELRLVILDETGELEVAGTDLSMEPATTGLKGDKFAISGQERYGVFSVQLRFDPAGGTYKISITSLVLTGLAPADVLPGLEALAALRPPNLMQLRLRNGPALDEPHPIPEVINEEAELIERVVRALATIQEQAYVQIRIPDLTLTSRDEAGSWLRAARLLRGDVLPIKWNRFGAVLNEDAQFPEGDAFAIAATIPLRVRVGEDDVDLGLQVVHLPTARIDGDVPAAGGNVDLIPAGDESGTIRWIGRPTPEPEA